MSAGGVLITVIVVAVVIFGALAMCAVANAYDAFFDDPGDGQ